jgi:hypothetical protein
VHRFRGETGVLLVQLPAGESPGAVIDAVDEAEARIEAIEISHEADRRNLELTVELRRPDAQALVMRVADVEGVLEVRWAD